jgi:hypothetical protein
MAISDTTRKIRTAFKEITVKLVAKAKIKIPIHASGMLGKKGNITPAIPLNTRIKEITIKTICRIKLDGICYFIN